MTVMGKILVFLVLVLALAQAALHIMIHLTQPNWVQGYKKLNEQYSVAQAEIETYRSERDDFRSIAEEARKDAQTKLDQKDAELKAKDQALADLRKERDDAKSAVVRRDADQVLSTTDVQHRQDEVGKLEEANTVKDKRIKELLQENTKLSDRAVAAEITARSLEERNKSLVAQLEEASRELVRSKSVTGGTPGADTRTARNPPPENVEGRVTRADPAGMMTLSIGSDDGLARGQTLEVFRLNPAKYLGTIRIIQVSPHEAVGQPISRPLGQIQEGDRVASRIVGG